MCNRMCVCVLHLYIWSGNRKYVGFKWCCWRHLLIDSAWSWNAVLSLVAQMVKSLPTMWETRVRSLGREDPLEKEIATHSSTLAWKIPWTEERGRLQSMGSQRVGHDWATSLHFTNDNGELDYLAKCIEKIGCSFKKNKAKYNRLVFLNSGSTKNVSWEVFKT